MEITGFTLVVAEKYRKARDVYLGSNAVTTPRGEIELARQKFLIAAQDLASSVLADIDKAKGAS